MTSSTDPTPGASASAADDHWYERWFGEDYLALYPHRDQLEAERIVAMIERHLGGRRIDRALDLACGAGRHSRVLGKLWWTVGYDLSAALLNVAKREAPEAVYVRGDVRLLPFARESFALVVNLFTSFGYFSNDAEHEAVIAEVAAVTAPGGTFAIDYLNPAFVARTLNPRDERTVNGCLVEQERRITPDGRYVEKRITLCDKMRSFVERVRLYSRADLESMLGRSGFDVEMAAGDYDGTAWTPESPRTILLAVKP